MKQLAEGGGVEEVLRRSDASEVGFDQPAFNAVSPLLQVSPGRPVETAWIEIRLLRGSLLFHDSPEFPVR